MSIDDLVDKHGEETVKQAFWLQEHIYEQGLPAANFTQVGESTMESFKGSVIKANMERHLPSRSL